MDVRSIHFYAAAGIVLAVLTAIPRDASAQQTQANISAEVQQLCTIPFDRDELRPARVENRALPCLQQGAAALREHPDRKLVLVGVKDPAKDHELQGNGSDREEEDATGFDVRLEDLAAYRAVNTKWYLVHYLGANPKRILPTTDESRFAQTVTLYLVPGTADFLHNFLGTTKTNEKPCTIKPCYSADEETLSAQPRPRIVPGSTDGDAAEKAAEVRQLAAQKRSRKPLDMEGTAGDTPLKPLPPRPTPDHPATASIIPQ